MEFGNISDKDPIVKKIVNDMIYNVSYYVPKTTFNQFLLALIIKEFPYINFILNNIKLHSYIEHKYLSFREILKIESDKLLNDTFENISEYIILDNPEETLAYRISRNKKQKEVTETLDGYSIEKLEKLTDELLKFVGSKSVRITK